MKVPGRGRWALFWKRALDLVIAVPLLLLAAPLLLLVSVPVWLLDRGPVLFRQQREGLQGRRFTLWKLRTMYRRADDILESCLGRHPEAQAEWQAYCRLRDDPRVLPLVGRLARRYSIDELPQLWNVIEGSMSLVGPRPVAVDHLPYLRPRYRRLRARVKPGLTGLWQVSGRSDLELARMEGMDALYVRRFSFWLDLWILLRTVPAVLSGRGAY